MRATQIGDGNKRQPQYSGILRIEAFTLSFLWAWMLHLVLTSIPPQQHNTTETFLSEVLVKDDATRAFQVKQTAAAAWKAYEVHAWGYDTLLPLSGTGENDFGGMAVTMIDSLDTLFIMGLHDQFENASRWLTKNLKFNVQENVNVFETNIRVLGGLLSAYEMSRNAAFKDLAVQVADKLLLAIHEDTGLPFGTVGFRSGTAYNPHWSNGYSSISEVGTLQLEFRHLSHIAEDDKYKIAVDHISHWFSKQIKSNPRVFHGLFPMFVDPKTGRIAHTKLTVGARVDSLYEYFLKGWLQTNRTETWIKDMFDVSAKGILKVLLKVSKGEKKFVYLAEIDQHGKVLPVMEHLACFIPGMFALSGMNGNSEHLHMARQLMRTCYFMYKTTPTGLAPEIVEFDKDGEEIRAKSGAKHSILRPEVIESLYMLFMATKNSIYKDWAWEIFTRYQTHARIEGRGFTGIRDVTSLESGRINRMESFFLGETLKYLYLLFSEDDRFPLDKLLFTTEAHILPVI